MGSLLRYCPLPSFSRVVVWLLLPVLYFLLPEAGFSLNGRQVSRVAAAVCLHLPILLAVSLYNGFAYRSSHDRAVSFIFMVFPTLVVLIVIDAIILSADSAAAAKHVLSVQAAAMAVFHVWALSYPETLRKTYRWPWSGLPRGLTTASVIRGFGHVLVITGNEALIRLAPDTVWVIGAGLLPILALLLADVATVYALFAMGLRPRGFEPGADADNGISNLDRDGS